MMRFKVVLICVLAAMMLLPVVWAIDVRSNGVGLLSAKGDGSRAVVYMDDWVVASGEYNSTTNATIVINGIVYVEDGATLEISYSTLTFNPATNNGGGIYVYGGGSLILSDVILTANGSNTYHISVGEMASPSYLSMRNVTISGISPSGLSLLNVADAYMEGVDIVSGLGGHTITAQMSNMHIADSTFHGGEIGLYLTGSHVDIIGCEIKSPVRYGLYAEDNSAVNTTAVMISGGEINAVFIDSELTDTDGNLGNATKYNLYLEGTTASLHNTHMSNATMSNLISFGGDITGTDIYCDSGTYGLYLNSTEANLTRTHIILSTYGIAAVNATTLTLSSGEVTVSNIGVVLRDSMAWVEDYTVANPSGEGIYAEYSDLFLNHSAVSGSNAHGIYALYSLVYVDWCTLSANSNDAVYANHTTIHIKNSTLSQNSDNGVEMDHGVGVVENSTLELNKKVLECLASTVYMNHSAIRDSGFRDLLLTSTALNSYNSTVGTDDAYLAQGSTISIYWPVRFHVYDAMGRGIGGANVSCISSNALLHWRASTSANGLTPWTWLKEKEITGGDSVVTEGYNPYNISVEAFGRTWNFTDNITGPKTVEFELPNEPPPLPRPLTPPNGSVIRALNVNISWSSVYEGEGNDYIDHYSLHIAWAGGDSVFNTTNTNYSFTGEDNTLYSWYVVAVDSFGAESVGWAWYLFAIDLVNEGPSMVVPTYPKDGAAVSDLDLRLEWSGGTDPDPLDTVSFIVEVSEYPDLSQADVYNTTSHTLVPENVGYGKVYYWSVRAVDSYGLSSNRSRICSFSVWRGNRPPTIVSRIPDQVGYEDTAWSLKLTPYESDDSDFGPRLRWYVSNYNTSLIEIFGELSENDTLVLVPKRDAYGSTQALAHLIDSEGAEAVQWFNITVMPVNDPPAFAQPPNLLVHYNVPYTFDYAPYITDVDNPISDITLSVGVGGGGEEAYVTVSGTALTFEYPASMNGEVRTVSITAKDMLDATTVFINVRISDDYIPELTAHMPDIEIEEGGKKEWAFNLDDYFYDNDDATLYYSYGYTHISVVIEDNHSVSFYAPPDWYGVERVTFRATDPKGGLKEDSINVTVIPVNDPPVISPLPNLYVHFNETYEFDLGPYIYDSDNPYAELRVDVESPYITGFNLNGSLYLQINFPRTFNGTTQTVEISVNDTFSCSKRVLNITVGDNFPPELRGHISTVQIEEDSVDVDAFSLQGIFYDRDDSTLAISFFNNGSIAISVDEGGNVTLTPVPNWYGVERVTFRATDPKGGLKEFTLSVVVMPINDPPVINITGPITVTAGRAVVIDLGQYISDVDNTLEEVSIKVTSRYGTEHKTDVAVLSGTLLILNYPVEAGGTSDIISITVSDGHPGGIAVRTINVSVEKELGGGTARVSGGGGQGLYILVIIVLVVILSIIGYVFYHGYYRIKEIFLIFASDGTLLCHISAGPEEGRDADIISGMLTAVQDFVADAFEVHEGMSGGGRNGMSDKGAKHMDKRGLKKLQFGDKNILIERGKYTYLAVVISGHEGYVLHRKMGTAISRVEKIHGGALGSWRGVMDDIAGVEAIIRAEVLGE